MERDKEPEHPEQAVVEGEDEEDISDVKPDSRILKNESRDPPPKLGAKRPSGTQRLVFYTIIVNLEQIRPGGSKGYRLGGPS